MESTPFFVRFLLTPPKEIKKDTTMPTPNDQLIAQIKLAEMHRQRDQLSKHYAALEEKARAAGSDLERFHVLYESLQQIKFAQKPLHPDVANLNLLFLEEATGTASAAMIGDWNKRLERELQQGRLRTEFAHAFGQTLSEGATAPMAAPENTKIGSDGDTNPWQVLLQPPPASVDLNWIREWFRKNQQPLTALREMLQTYGNGEALNPATKEEVKALLALQSGDDFRQPYLRRQAMTAARSETMVDELTDTLTILLNNLDDWNWPEAGVRPVATWKNQKWRPYLEEDLVHLLFVQLIGLRWGMKIKPLVRNNFLQPYGTTPLFPLKTSAPWTAENQLLVQLIQRAATFFLPMIPDSLPAPGQKGGYGGGSGGYGRGRQIGVPAPLEQLLILIQAEILFHQAAFPNVPLHVVQTDLRDFYLRIPHAVLLEILDQLGVPERWRAFFQKYLAISLQEPDGSKQAAQRGLVLGHLIGSVLSEWVLLMMDAHVFQTTKLRLLHVVDDIFFFTDDAKKARNTWKAIAEFCQACGMEINEKKTGSVCLGGSKDPKLPAGLPSWGLLRLHEDSVWRVDEDEFNKVQKNVREEVTSAPTVLSKVARYNEHVLYLQKNLGLCAPLGTHHLQHVGKCLAQLHQQLFGAGHGMVEELHQRLQKLFLDVRLQKTGLPEALVYWPITAGGLGLTHPLINVAGFQKGLEGMPRKQSPVERGIPWTSDTSHQHYYEWINYYNQLGQPVPLSSPSKTPAMERLVQDFIARGSEVGGREQKGLSNYWQWIVYTYGPSLLEALGTFRFLLTELVPLQLILENRLDISGLAGASSGNASATEMPF